MLARSAGFSLQKTADAPQLKLGDLADKAVLLRKADKNIR